MEVDGCEAWPFIKPRKLVVGDQGTARDLQMKHKCPPGKICRKAAIETNGSWCAELR